MPIFNIKYNYPLEQPSKDYDGVSITGQIKIKIGYISKTYSIVLPQLLNLKQEERSPIIMCYAREQNRLSDGNSPLWPCDPST